MKFSDFTLGLSAGRSEVSFYILCYRGALGKRRGCGVGLGESTGRGMRSGREDVREAGGASDAGEEGGDCDSQYGGAAGHALVCVYLGQHRRRSG